ncbi:MAG: PEP-CTERM sorting domain-containing protein [Acidobacteriota bacterium]|nr:PEP-CTERM sorting domain-containing protein [Acidobacteriota bacterium]
MVLNKKLLATTFGGILCLAAFNPADAAFVTIPLPATLNYTTSTTLIPIPVVAQLDANPVTSLSNGAETISFSSPDAGTQFVIQPPVPVGFQTWNSPPFVETSTPPIIQDKVSTSCSVCTMSLTFSTPVKTFGVELEPDPFPTTHTISAIFLNGGSTVGNIAKTFTSGNGTASLFAATTTDQQFTSVNVTIDGTDFASAQYRYSASSIAPPPGVPEPGTILLMAGGLLAIGYRKFHTVR